MSKNTGFWVVEGAGSDAPTYWDGHDAATPYFTPKIEDALQFSRCEDAQRAINWLLPAIVRGAVAARNHAYLEREP